MHRSNSFDIVRHIAALIVLISHHFVLSGMKEPTFPGFKAWGTVALIAFFSISGYLITKSMMRSDCVAEFTKKRLLRIYPGLIACGLVIYILMPLIYYISGGGIDAFRMISSFIKTLVMLPYYQPSDMTVGYIYTNAINGSLWSLPIEVLCYGIIATCLSIKKDKSSIFIVTTLSIVLAMMSYFSEHDYIFYSISMKHAIPLLASFMIGASVGVSDSFKRRGVILLSILVSALLIAGSVGRQDFMLSAFFFMPVLIISVGLIFKDNLIKGRFDYSYGIYIYAFPIQQIIINETDISFLPGMLISIILTVVFASISWHLVEKRFLIKKAA